MEGLMEKVNIVLDASKIDLFETCPFRYHARHNLNKVLPMIHKAKALDKGSLAHGGLEVYFNLLAKGEHYNDRMQATLMKIRELGSDPNNSNTEPEEVDEILSAVEQSCDYWRAEDENQLEILAVEQAFIYTLYEDEQIRILITGKIDLLTNYRGLGRNSSYSNRPMDHKTFSRESMLLRKSNQFINYCNAVGSNFLVVNRIGLQKSKSAEEKFKRLPLSYDPLYIENWKKNLTARILSDYLTCVAEDYWPETPTSCNKFNRLCEYYSNVCDASLTYEDKIIRLKEDFVDAEPWDVTKGLGEQD